MEHFYSVLRNKPLLHAKSFLENGILDVKSSLSNNNVLAFTSNIDLLDSSQKNLRIHVYVIDLNLPYYPYLVSSYEDNITVLEWDNKSTKLLIGDETGSIQVWSTCDYLISEWQLIYSHCFSGDIILAGIWFQNGTKFQINSEKKDTNVAYQEKFRYTKNTPSVVQFGNTHTDGFLCLTSSGFIYAHLFCSDGKTMTGYDLLCNYRSKYQRMDISHMKNGNFLICTSSGDARLPLTCFTVKVEIKHKDKSKLELTCQPFSSFTLNCVQANSNTQLPYTNITNLRFMILDIPNSILVSASGANGSIIELWELSEKTLTFHPAIHNLLQQQNQKIEINPTVSCWKYITSTSFSSHLSAIITPKTNLFDINPSPSFLIAAFTDDTIKCLNQENLQLLTELNLSTITINNQTNVNKNPKLIHPNIIPPVNTNRNNNWQKLSTIRNLQLTWSSSAMIAIDSYSQIHLFRLSPTMEPNVAMSLNHAQLMLEYSIMTGNDYWDILISMKPSYVETICDRINDCFLSKQQNQSMQQKWLDSVLQLKATLFRCINPGPSTNHLCKAGDYHTSKMLYAIFETIKRLIRAREYFDNEGPAEKLSHIIQSKPTDIQMLNLDKILIMLDSKDFTVETNTQLAFKYLFQWVYDLSLYILASIPQQYNQNQYRLPGVGLVFDTKAVNTLRELLVILRFWGIMNSTVLPTILKLQDNCDVIATIFKLLSKVVASAQSDKFEENLVDECCLLSNQVVIPQMELCPKSIGIASPTLYGNTLPLIFDYGEEPSFMKYSVKIHSIDGSTNYFCNRKMDIVRYIAIGSIDDANSNIRRCTRCSAVSLKKSPLRFAAARAWEFQWSKKCFCGGLWRQNYLNINSS